MIECFYFRGMIIKRANCSFTFSSLTSVIISIGLVLILLAIIYASFDMHFALAQQEKTTNYTYSRRGILKIKIYPGSSYISNF